MNKLTKVAVVATGVAALATLTACGDYGAGANSDKAVGGNTSVVEYRDRRVNVPVEVTPQACLDAVDIAEEVFAISADVSKAASRGFHAAADFDIDGIKDAGAAFRRASADLDPLIPRWHTARDDCRAADD